MKKLSFFLFSIVLTQQLCGQNRTENFRMILHDDWRMQSSLTDKVTGEQVSKKLDEIFGLVCSGWSIWLPHADGEYTKVWESPKSKR